MKKILMTAALMMGILSASAQTEVEPFVPGSTLDGVSYFLPKTALRLVVEVEQTDIKPGDFAKYAFHYLRLKDVPTEASTSYKLKSIKAEAFGMPDGKKAYSIKVKSKTIAPLVSLTHDGILMSINKEAQEPTLSAIPADIPAPQLGNPRDYMTQEMLVAGSTSKQAELCAQEIYDIRESRNALVRGEADNTPKDGAQLQLMLSQLDQQADALESLFKGTTTSSTHYVVLNVVPNEEKESILFRFSKKLGVVESDNLAGIPVYISLQPQETLPTRVANEDTSKKKEKMEKGVYYNIPIKEAIKIYDDDTTYMQFSYPMAQFGTTEILSDALFNKNVTTKVSFFPQTGGIDKLEQ